MRATGFQYPLSRDPIYGKEKVWPIDFLPRSSLLLLTLHFKICDSQEGRSISTLSTFYHSADQLGDHTCYSPGT